MRVRSCGVSNVDLCRMSVTPVCLQSVEEPHGEVAHQEERHHLSARLGLGNGLVAGVPDGGDQRLYLYSEDDSV